MEMSEKKEESAPLQWCVGLYLVMGARKLLKVQIYPSIRQTLGKEEGSRKRCAIYDGRGW